MSRVQSPYENMALLGIFLKHDHSTEMCDKKAKAESEIEYHFQEAKTMACLRLSNYQNYHNQVIKLPESRMNPGPNLSVKF